MEQILNEEKVKAAELVVSRCFEISGHNKIQSRVVIGYGKSSGLKRAEIKEARKRLGVKSVKEDEVYWWIWPEAPRGGEQETE